MELALALVGTLVAAVVALLEAGVVDAFVGTFVAAVVVGAEVDVAVGVAVGTGVGLFAAAFRAASLKSVRMKTNLLLVAFRNGTPNKTPISSVPSTLVAAAIRLSPAAFVDPVFTPVIDFSSGAVR